MSTARGVDEQPNPVLQCRRLGELDGPHVPAAKPGLEFILLGVHYPGRGQDTALHSYKIIAQVDAERRLESEKRRGSSAELWRSLETAS